MSQCDRCRLQGERQQEQMKPRLLREGVCLVASRDAFCAYGHFPLPDVRMGDVVRVTLVAAAVEDMGWCSDSDCDNYVGLL